MDFYVGKEYKAYAKKFENIKDYCIRNRIIKSNSNAALFRWMVDEMDKLIESYKKEESKHEQSK